MAPVQFVAGLPAMMLLEAVRAATGGLNRALPDNAVIGSIVRKTGCPADCPPTANPPPIVVTPPDADAEFPLMVLLLIEAESPPLRSIPPPRLKTDPASALLPSR